MVFTLGQKTLETFESPINGKVEVIKSIAWGTYIQVEGLTQSGGILYDVWKSPLKKVARQKKTVDKVLILGLAGGSAAKLVKKFWPEAKITGVDIDPIMVDIGRKYLGLDDVEVEVIIGDALSFLKKRKSNKKGGFDLILIDMYVGTQVPEQFETENFIKIVKPVLADDGIAIFNRLYYGEKKDLASAFHKKLEKYFSEIIPVYPEANVMFVCSNVS